MGGASFWALSLTLLVLVLQAGEAKGAGTVGTLRTANAAGGKGAYYLPEGYRGGGRLPLALLLHWSGGRGEDMVKAFRRLADVHKFIIVAPDSNNRMYWLPLGADSRGADMPHIMSCLAEARALQGVKVDAGRILVGGFSGGGQMTPYVGFSHPDFSAVAVMHGRIEKSSGPFYRMTNLPNVWYSCGATDHLCDYDNSAEALRTYCDFRSLTIVPKSRYSGGHKMSEQEKEDMVKWWLKGAGSTPPKSFTGGIPQLPATAASARALQRRLALGRYHAVVLRKDGTPLALKIPGRDCTLACQEQGCVCSTPKFPTLSPVVAVSASKSHSPYLLAVTKQGTAHPRDYYGSACGSICSALAPLQCLQTTQDVFEGGQSLVIFKNGTINCYLQPGVPQAGVPGVPGIPNVPGCSSMPRGLKAATASAGRRHSLAVTPEGRVFAWGCDGSNKAACAVPADLGKAVAVAAGETGAYTPYSMALLEGGKVRMWPQPGPDQADSFYWFTSMPAAVSQPAPNNPVVAIAATENAYALLANGTLWAWGPDYQGKGASGWMERQARVLLEGLISMQVQMSDKYDMSMLFVKQDGSVWFTNLPSANPDQPHPRLFGTVRLAPPGTMV